MDLHLFDIEGTIAPIDYVHNVMFPYAKKFLAEYIIKNGIEENIKNEIINENKVDFASDRFHIQLTENSPLLDFSHYLHFLIRVDRKSKPLKEIQGKIWKMGFESGELKSIIYPDTLTYFQFLQKNQSTIMIYSSGSIEAQKLYLKYSDLGDLSPFIQGNFDTAIGNKRDVESYRQILAATQKARLKTFYTDIVEEAEAAIQAGFTVYLVSRNAAIPLAPVKENNSLNSFYQIPNFKQFSNKN